MVAFANIWAQDTTRRTHTIHIHPSLPLRIVRASAVVPSPRHEKPYENSDHLRPVLDRTADTDG
jgi:hypothetical protein